mgnify:CR=1 FL=1
MVASSDKTLGIDIKFTIISALALVLTSYVLLLVFNKILTKGTTCKYEYNELSKYSNLNAVENDNNLGNHYIKTAYNCCSVADKWVNICALKYTIKEGCRCLDFEIFDVNGEPVVGTTLSKNGTEKDSYNHLKLSEVLETIHDMAFNRNNFQGTVYEDPLLLNFRIKSTSVNIYDKMSDDIYDILNDKLLNTTYSFYNRDNSLIISKPTDGSSNIFQKPINDLKGKIIIMSSDCNLTTMNKSKLSELVNVVGSRTGISGGLTCSIDIELQLTSKNYPLIQLNNSHVVSGTNQINNLNNVTTDSNYAVIMIPDDNNNNNINYCYQKKQGIQMIGMLFQRSVPKDYSKNKWLYLNTVDDDKRADLLEYEELGNIENYNRWFLDNESAFILKGDENEQHIRKGCNSSSIYDNGQGLSYLDEEEEETSKVKKYKDWFYKFFNNLGF